MQANRSRREVEFNVGDKVLVNLQPYRQITLARRLSNKQAKRYYGSFEILERVGKVAYRLGLPSASKIHTVFHVSLLKPFIGEGIVGVTNLPEEDREGQPVCQPLAVCATCDILRNREPSRQILVQWRDCSPEEATWEDLSESLCSGGSTVVGNVDGVSVVSVSLRRNITDCSESSEDLVP
ncbi:ty3-gypsy retrotransposon protein [Tanacetum coccineum]|uniref:Ty3-gypsy retrotransposon protein n=1 Tax=Tanacetum coccineum TaxID=301880 RepID=A0ABQ4WP54_9ASTR